MMHWRPCLAFYERRIELLRLWESSDLLVAFQVAHDRISAVVGEDTFVSVGTAGLDITTLTTEDEAFAARLISEATEMLGVDAISGVTSDLQFLVSVDLDYDEARRRLAAPMVGAWFESSQLIDSAMLLDGRSRDGAAHFQIEFGVVSREEVAQRTSRMVGRLSNAADFDISHGLQRLDPATWSAETPDDAPAVSLFADWHWRFIDTPPEGATIGDVLPAWRALMEESAEVVGAIGTVFDVPSARYTSTYERRVL
jgi:hypothetical protein